MNSSLHKLRIEPEAGEWGLGGTSKRLLGSPSPAKSRFREQLGLPAGVPLVLSGHQAELWHPGILAKLFASIAFAESAARRGEVGAAAAWLVVDQDEADHVGVRIPVRDSLGALKAVDWRWADAAGRTSAGLGVVAAAEPRLKAGETAAISCVSSGIAAIRDALNETAKASENWARQVSAATVRLLEPVVPVPQFAFESNLARTDLFQRITDAMSNDATTVIRAYNAAVVSVPEAGMRPLDASKAELPLWSIAGGIRRRVLAQDLVKIDRTQLAPRGLLMTAIMRLAGCELFIHGMGGVLYDRATEAWVRAWAGELATIAREFGTDSAGSIALAPMTMVTADLLLPLAPDGTPSETEIAKGVWFAHHAKHDPLALGDTEGGLSKTRLLEAIRNRKRRGERPVQEFAALQELLTKTRQSRAAEVERLQQEASRLAGQRSEAALAHDRTWSFALHPRESLRELLEACRGAFAAP